jgi:hypothetical protein
MTVLLLEDFPAAMRVSVEGTIGTDDFEPTRRVVRNLTVKIGEIDVTDALSEATLSELEDRALEVN